MSPTTVSLRRRAAFGLLVLALAAGNMVAADELEGDWLIQASGFAFGGQLSPIDVRFERRDGSDEYDVWVYNGPVEARVDGRSFEIDLDWKTLFDTVHVSTLRGELTADGSLSGAVDHGDEENFLGDPLPPGSFTGKRHQPLQIDRDAEPDPIDLTGVWNRAVGQWPVRKIEFAMTPEAESVMRNYLDMDNPGTRCAPEGLVLLTAYRFLPIEILHTDEYLLMLYGADYVRRIYLDGREPPADLQPSSLGFSTGKWLGSVLEITTTHLTPAFMSARGQPVSADAKVVEHFFLDDRGSLHGDMWLYDPDNYTRPPFLRKTFDRDFRPTVITEFGCDPYPFFRELYLEGKLEEFFGRRRERR